MISRTPHRFQATLPYFKTYLSVLISLVSMSFISSPLIAHAQAPTLVKQSNAFPQEIDFYSADDPLRDIKITTEQMMGLYLVNPPRRHISEHTDYSNDHLHFHLWYPISGRSNRQLWSKAASWLVFGRIKYSSGARGIFSELPTLKRITLSLHEVIRPDEKGRRRSKKPDQVHIYLTISLTRDNFERFDIEALRLCSLNLDCDKTVRQMFSLLKFNTRYLKRKK